MSIAVGAGEQPAWSRESRSPQRHEVARSLMPGSTYPPNVAQEQKERAAHKTDAAMGIREGRRKAEAAGKHCGCQSPLLAVRPQSGSRTQTTALTSRDEAGCEGPCYQPGPERDEVNNAAKNSPSARGIGGPSGNREAVRDGSAEKKFRRGLIRN